MEVGAISGGDDTQQRKVNKYALACAVVASMISIIFGYGNTVGVFLTILKSSSISFHELQY